jgi:uncharacterized protein (DUF4415 family)
MEEKNNTEAFDGAEPVDPEFDIDLSKTKPVPREKRHDAAPGEADLRNCKVRVSLYLDADILEYFKDQAEKPYAADYPTQINSALRGFIEQITRQNDFQRLLDDDHFIKAVAERVKETQG